MAMMAARVRRADFTAGSRNAITPLLTASTPVSAVQPLENALSISHQPTRRGDRRERRRRHHRRGRAAGGQRLEEPDGDHRQQRSDEQVRGRHEHQPGFAQAAEVDQRDRGQDAQAQRQGMRQQRGHGGNQRAHAGGNADGDVEDVVDHQGGAGQQARKVPQVLARHGERSAAAGVRFDGLAVREVDDGQQPDDPQAERHDVMAAQFAQRPQNGERGLRPVSRRTQSVEAEDGDPAATAIRCAPLLAGGKRAAEQNVQKGHGLLVYRGGANCLHATS